MRFSRRSTSRIGIAAVATFALFVACNDSPAGPAATATNGDVAFAKGGKDKPRTQHYARVASDGTLVDGTAVSAERTAEGAYAVTFDNPVDGCAGAASIAVFTGGVSTGTNITATLLIGRTPIGLPAPHVVSVVTDNAADASAVDTSFTLLLFCP